VIDIHSHIIYGVDDGSKTLESSIAMLRMAAEAGTTDIVATPHANDEYSFRPTLISERLAEIQAQVPEIRVHTGCDFHLNYENVQDCFQNPSKYTVNHKSYLLVEFPDGALIPNIEQIFERMLGMNIVPIMTHPERNWIIQQSLEKFESWVRMGALTQVTGGSLTGRFGKPAQKFAEQIIHMGLCHFIASDAHDTLDRHPRLTNSFEIVRKKWGEQTADRFFVANGQAVIDGATLDREEAVGTTGKKRKRWFFF
jgi:protein-tyrosine phosphatase